MNFTEHTWERANAFALPEIMFSGLPPLVSATTWRKYLRGLESHRKFSATTDRSTATLDIGSATTMSFNNEAAKRALHRGTQRRFYMFGHPKRNLVLFQNTRASAKILGAIQSFAKVRIFLIPLSITFENLKILGFLFLKKKFNLGSKIWKI